MAQEGMENTEEKCPGRCILLYARETPSNIGNPYSFSCHFGLFRGIFSDIFYAFCGYESGYIYIMFRYLHIRFIRISAVLPIFLCFW